MLSIASKRKPHLKPKPKGDKQHAAVNFPLEHLVSLLISILPQMYLQQGFYRFENPLLVVCHTLPLTFSRSATISVRRAWDLS